MAPGLHAGPLRELGRGPQRRLAGQPPALLRRAVPGLVPARRRRRARLRRPDRPPRSDAAGRPVDRRARTGYERGAARPARRVRRRPRRHGHLGHVVAHAADRQRLGRRPRPVRPHVPDGPAPAGPRDHPHLAVLHRRARPPRARRAAVGDAAISGWILDPDRKKMSKSKGNVVTPLALLERVRLRRRPLLGGQRRTGHRHRRRRGPDEDRPPAGDQDPQRAASSCSASADRRPTRPTITEPLDRAMLARLADVGRRSHRRVRRLRLRPGARAHRDVLLVVLRRLPRAGQDRAYGDGAGADSARAALAHRACPCCSGCSRRSCRSSPKRCGRGGRTARSTGRRGRPSPSSSRCSAGRRPARPDAWPTRVLGEIRKAKSDAKKSMRVEVASVVVTAGPSDAGPLRQAADDVRAAGRVADLTIVEADDGAPLTVDVVLAET